MIMLNMISCSKEAYILGTQRNMKMLQYCGISKFCVLDYFFNLSFIVESIKDVPHFAQLHLPPPSPCSTPDLHLTIVCVPGL